MARTIKSGNKGLKRKGNNNILSFGNKRGKINENKRKIHFGF
jgi:hypothetical protein